MPQKDGLLKTIEENSELDYKARERKFGQWDHRRIFGSDFAEIVSNYNFEVMKYQLKILALRK